MIYTPSQRAMFAAKRANATKADGPKTCKFGLVTVPAAATEVGVGERIVHQAKRLRREAAPEIVRCAERCIGLAIRKGQADGRIAKRGSIGSGAARGHDLNRPKDFVHVDDLSNGPYALADGVSPEQFEKGLTKAKSEKNLSRANVVRKVKGADSLARKAGAEEAARHALDIRLRAERRIGEMLAGSVGPGRPDKSSPSTRILPSGVSWDQSSKYQRVAELAEPEFERVLSSAEPSTSALLKPNSRDGGTTR